MMKGYEVLDDNDEVISLFTDVNKAYDLLQKHPLINMRIKAIDISVTRWLWLKLFLQ